MTTMKFIYTYILVILSAIAYSQEITEVDVKNEATLIEAKGYSLTNQYEKAKETLLPLYKANRSNATVAFELSKIYSQLKDTEQQYEYAKKAATLAPQNEAILSNYGKICFELDRMNDAVAAYQKLVTLDPYSEEYTDKLATAYLATDQSKAALTVYNNLEKKIGIRSGISRRKFELYEQQKDTKAALAELENLADAYPNDLKALHPLAAYYQKLGNDKKAKETYTKILVLDANDTKANIALMGDVDAPSSDGNYLRAIAPIIDNPDIAIDNKVRELIPYVQKLQSNPQDTELAPALVELSQRLVANHPKEAKGYAIQGDILQLSGRLDDAIKSYEKTLELDDSVYDVWEQLMYAYSEKKEYKKLVEKSEMAMDLFPNKASAIYLYALGNRKSKMSYDLDDVLSYLEDGKLIAGKDNVSKSNILTELAYVYAAKKEFDNAKKAIDEALLVSDNKNTLALKAKTDILKLEK